MLCYRAKQEEQPGDDGTQDLRLTHSRVHTQQCLQGLCQTADPRARSTEEEHGMCSS